MIKYLSRLALKYGLIPFAHNLIRAYLSLIRIRIFNEDMALKYLASGGKMIVALWHQRILAVMGYARRFGIYEPSVMISQSRDGEMIADVYRRFNFRPVRGSSSRGGKQALAEMVASLSDHQIAVHVLDGPRGPRGVVKPGLIVMAQLSGIPIVPIYITSNRAWILKSWDRTMIPKPFSTITFRWGEPVYVPKNLDGDSFENIRKQIENQMKENQIQDDRDQGWTDPVL
ncbi:MAG TPA: lysophospholipid acyltransferase family protein [Syntrophales bacterium]|nr:lysophospholipid acyltransferase family protein [Syntrophales bacterium]